MFHDSDLSIIILAAGQGNRMKSKLPKVLHTIGGKPILYHVIQAAKALAPLQIFIVYGFAGQQIREALVDDNIIWVEQVPQLGTADAVSKALPFIPSHHRCLILYGDVPLINHITLQRLLNETSAQAVGLLTAIIDAPQGFGRIIRDEHDKVISIIEEKDASMIVKKIHEINTGIFLVPVKQLNDWLPKLTNDNQQKEYYLTDIIAQAVQHNVPVISLLVSDQQEILGINDKAQQAQLERIYQYNLAQHFLKQGVSILDPHRFDVRGTLQAAADVRIDINTIFEGVNIIEEGAEIGANCILIDCQIGPSVKILPNSYLEQAIVKEGAIIGPFARLRPHTLIKEQARIGNFVEIKNTVIGKKSKVNHLSYLGDTDMGDGVNVGAGTITCNYDGVAKHRTIIEDGAQIGADCQLIAPITVHQNARIGAGSTLTKDAPAQQLTLTQRLEQRSKKIE